MLDPWIRKIPWRKAWKPPPVFLPGEFWGQRSLVGYSPWGDKESDTTEWLILSLFLSSIRGRTIFANIFPISNACAVAAKSLQSLSMCSMKWMSRPFLGIIQFDPWVPQRWNYQLNWLLTQWPTPIQGSFHSPAPVSFMTPCSRHYYYHPQIIPIFPNSSASHILHPVSMTQF